MNRLPTLASILLLSLLVAGGCADSNDNAPDVDEAHPADWILVHGEKAQDDLSRCRSCHGNDFQGREEAVSCFACHFAGPPALAGFTIHPPEWGENVIAGHQTFPEGYSWTTCANFACHGDDLKEGLFGPSCADCHAVGSPRPDENPPKDYVHTIEPPATRAYFRPENHGPDAQNQLIVCRNCHGRPERFFGGGFVADPAIRNFGGVASCTSCHPDAQAHPTNWQGTNDTNTPDQPGSDYVASHWDISQSAIDGCRLCHAVEPMASSPDPKAPSCFAPGFTKVNGSSTDCHSDGPSLLRGAN